MFAFIYFGTKDLFKEVILVLVANVPRATLASLVYSVNSGNYKILVYRSILGFEDYCTVVTNKE